MQVPKHVGWGVEERVAKFEAAVEHLTADMADVKSDVRGLHAKLDTFLAQMNARFTRMDERFAQIDVRFAQMDTRFERLESHFDRKLMTLKIWSLLLHLTIAAGLLGVMARGFHWLP